MKLKLKKFLVTSLTSIFALVWGAPAKSRPYPDQTGVCYFYRGEIQELLDSCVISSGYGAGVHYSVLHWPDGVDTNVSMINFCPDSDYDDRGFCRYTVDDYDAEPYERNVFLQITTAQDPENLTCYRIIETSNSVCYRFNP